MPPGCYATWSNGGGCAVYYPDFRTTTGNANADVYLADSRKCITANFNRYIGLTWSVRARQWRGCIMRMLLEVVFYKRAVPLDISLV